MRIVTTSEAFKTKVKNTAVVFWLQTSLSTNSDVQLVKHDQGRTQVILKLFSGANFRKIMKHNLNTQNWLDMDKYIQCCYFSCGGLDPAFPVQLSQKRWQESFETKQFTVYCLQTDQPESIAWISVILFWHSAPKSTIQILTVFQDQLDPGNICYNISLYKQWSENNRDDPRFLYIDIENN